MAAESIVKAMRNETGKPITNYYDMNEEEREKVHDYFCNNSDVIFEENLKNYDDFTIEKQYFNATCMYTSKYYTNYYNLRFFFFFATGKDYHKFTGTTKIIDQESFFLSKDINSTFFETNKTTVEFVRHYQENQYFQVYFDRHLDGANITWAGMFHSKEVN